VCKIEGMCTGTGMALGGVSVDGIWEYQGLVSIVYESLCCIQNCMLSDEF